MGIVWTIVIGFLAGIIAKFIMPGENEPSGFVLTAILGMSELSWPHSWARRLDGTGLVRGLV